ncbi:hypothetical protein FIBSPDRAFT_979198 [Athelia psychrophila]|uniref:Uncharacterized protein n=1 Tax=Athelia psychrophila TaxID=1759441 RepID=A0A167SU84_9AGAM|nr:hypothetical protein FIBSPDRAFT_979198 [Fibularhizoctonia sp. CBS 109695]
MAIFNLDLWLSSPLEVHDNSYHAIAFRAGPTDQAQEIPGSIASRLAMGDRGRLQVIKANYWWLQTGLPRRQVQQAPGNPRHVWKISIRLSTYKTQDSIYIQSLANNILYRRRLVATGHPPPKASPSAHISNQPRES